MKILGVVGSPRKGGNTEILMREALREAQEAGCDMVLARSAFSSQLGDILSPHKQP